MAAGTTFHVLLVGIDGVRLDCLHSAATPVLDSLIQQGFLAATEVNAAGPTISGPSWATVATGVLSGKHLIYDNDLRGHALDRYPDVLSRVRAAGLGTYAAAAWGPLLTAEGGGPVFAGGGFAPTPVSHDPAGWDAADQAVTDHAAGVLRTADIRAAFVYLGLPDEVAHQVDTGPAYIQAIERSDTRVGELVTAVESRPGLVRAGSPGPRAADPPGEVWTVLVVTDHGHVDGGGHGGDTPEERTAWIIAAGDVGADPPAGLGQVDVAPEILRRLGIVIDPRWGLDGSPAISKTRSVEVS